MKILSPAGNFECLKMAVYNGADEVYLGINEFNARNNIDGFNLENLKNAVDFAHIFGAKVLLAINILFNDDELQSALDIVVDAYNLGVDAFIIQDLGLAFLLHKHFPEIELHASTQMGIHNLEGVKEIESFGFKRVVLARETPLEEIKRIKENSDVEIEYFVQGALCVSFSGNCYLSSYLCNASGNRGRCKQLCRLPYTLEKDGRKIKSGFLLSAKDFNMTSKINDLKSAGVDVLKIEGRARRPFYVATTTQYYRNLLDGKKVDEEKLKLAFNRNFTAGYFDGNGNIISNFQNHIGINVGVVEKFVKGKNFNEVYFSSNRKLFAKSTFKFFDNEQEQNTVTAYDLKELKEGRYVLTTTQNIKAGQKVHLIVDSKLEDEVVNLTKRQKVTIEISAKENEPIKAILFFDKEIEIFGEVCEKAKNQPLTKTDFIENFKKNEYFEAKIVFSNFDNIFITKQKLNEFRRKVFEKIYEIITLKYKHNLNKIKIVCNYQVKKFENFKIIENSTEKLDAENIVYSPSQFALEDVKFMQNRCKNKKLFLDTPNFALKKDVENLKDIIEKTGVAIVANNYYALCFNTEKIVGAGLNIFNKVSASVFDLPIITAESDLSTKINFPYMTLRHCPFKNLLNASCEKCPYQEGYSYRMSSGKNLKLKRKKLSTCTFYLTE